MISILCTDMRITTKGRYAVRALLNLAATAGDRPKPIRRIAAEEEISPEFLEQIFFRLKRSGILSSTRGPGGGFRFARPLDQVSLAQVFVAVGEGLDLTPCTSCGTAEASESCERSDECLAHHVWNKTSAYIVEFFESMTIASILAEHADRASELFAEPAEA